MRILYVVQRYGDQIVGGSEAACRMYAENLVRRGHSVDVLTSCAHSYVDWADEYQPGTESINGVNIIRLPVVEPRQDRLFAPIHQKAMNHPRSLPLFEQQRWARLMGPQLVDMERWLLANHKKYELVVFMTYLYATATSGLPTIAGIVPTILQPTAHDEPPAYVGLYHSIFRQPDAFLFFTPEERDIVRDIYQIEPVGPVLGIGMDTGSSISSAAPFRQAFPGVADEYIIYVGRLDSSKGVGELIKFHQEYRRRNQFAPDLVLAGDGNLDVPSDAHLHVTGFLSEDMKKSAIAGSLLLVQPSYFESFSIVLCEAWLQERPALVQGACEVLHGQSVRSGGAIPYRGFAEYEAALQKMTNNRSLADLMGRCGRSYVKANYDWEVVISNFEAAAETAISNFSERRL